MNSAHIHNFAFRLPFVLRLFILCSPLFKKKYLKWHNWHCLLVTKMLISRESINLLKTKRNLLNIRNQFVPRSKQFLPQL
jgi:hypothetical protein